jgi:hypothetical protein
MYDFQYQTDVACRLPLAFSDAYDRDGNESSISAVGLILIAFAYLGAGAVLAFLGGFGILMSILIGWLSSFLGLFAVIVCIMLSDTFRSGKKNGAAAVANSDFEMDLLRARWNQNLAMSQMAQASAVRSYRR